MIRDIRYIIKKVIIGIAIIIGVLFFKTKLSLAATIDSIYVNGGSNNLTGWWFRQANDGNTFDFIGVGPETPEDNIYFNMLMCTDATSGTAWASANDPNTYSLTRTNTSINFTDIPCYVKDTNYKAHVVQVQSVTRTGADFGGDVRLYIHVSFNQNASISVNSYSFSGEQYPLVYSETDYTNQLNTMLAQMNSHWGTEINKLQDIWGVSQQQLAEAQQDVTDSDTDAMAEWLEDFSSDTYGLTSIITAPLNTIESLTNKSCSPLVVPLPFVNEDITLPCMSSIYSSTFGTAFTLYQTITTALIGYWCIVRIFAIVKGMKDPNDDKIEVVEL